MAVSCANVLGKVLRALLRMAWTCVHHRDHNVAARSSVCWLIQSATQQCCPGSHPIAARFPIYLESPANHLFLSQSFEDLRNVDV
jgi:hypothetical protein